MRGGSLRYHGGKFKSKHLLSFFPIAPISSYLEPFCGGAGLFWHLPVNIERWLNDIDKVLIAHYREARDHPRRFKRRILGMAQKIKRADDLAEEFLVNRVNYKFNHDSYAYWFVNRSSFGCYTSQQRSNSATLSWNLIRNGLAPFTPERLDFIIRTLRKVRLTAWHWRRAVESSPQDCFVYYDPPYHCHGQIYGYELTIEQHEELASFLAKDTRLWLMTIGYSELSQRLYVGKSWCRCRLREYKKCATPQQCGQLGQELIICNYD